MIYILSSDFHINNLPVAVLIRFDVLLYKINTCFYNGKV